MNLVVDQVDLNSSTALNSAILRFCKENPECPQYLSACAKAHEKTTCNPGDPPPCPQPYVPPPAPPPPGPPKPKPPNPSPPGPKNPQPPVQDQGPANNSEPQSAGNPSDSSAADLQTCQQLQRSASQCCEDPTSCLTAEDLAPTAISQSSTAGVASACQQAQQNGYAGGSTNNQAANACLNRYTNCISTCGSLRQGYANNPSVQQSFSDSIQSCRSLSAQVNTLTTQGASNLNAAANGQNCQQMTQAQPQSLSPQSGNANSAANAQACLNQPGSAACSAQATSASTTANQKGSLSYTDAKANGDPKFNLPDNSGTNAPGGPLDIGKPGQAPTVATIANNSGGSLPGSGGSGGGAKLSAQNTSNGINPGAPGYTTDIELGLRSGGYSSPVSSENNDQSPQVSGGIKNRSPASERMDLKQFLPGGRRDPGALRNSRSQEINGPTVDIWERITMRIQSMCRLGELFDCR